MSRQNGVRVSSWPTPTLRSREYINDSSNIGVLDFSGVRGYAPDVLASGVGMRGMGLVMVGLGLTVMLAGLAYSGVAEWHPNPAAAAWSFLGGTLLSVTGGILHTRA
jgi:hypothetical protein